MMRCKEEKRLLMTEAHNLLKFYHGKILPAISEDIRKYEEIYARCTQDDQVESDVNEVYTRRYHSCRETAMFLKGKISLLDQAKERVLSMLSSAIDLFQDTQFGNADIELINNDEFYFQNYTLMLSDSDSENTTDDTDNELTFND